MIFVDTSFFFPLLSANDRDHPRVREVFEGLGDRRLPDLLLTTNHVVAETITLARVRAGHDLAVKVGRYLYAEKMARILLIRPLTHVGGRNLSTLRRAFVLAFRVGPRRELRRTRTRGLGRSCLCFGDPD